MSERKNEKVVPIYNPIFLSIDRYTDNLWSKDEIYDGMIDNVFLFDHILTAVHDSLEESPMNRRNERIVILERVNATIHHPLIMHAENIKDMKDRNTSIIEADAIMRLQQTIQDRLRDSMNP